MILFLFPPAKALNFPVDNFSCETRLIDLVLFSNYLHLRDGDYKRAGIVLFWQEDRKPGWSVCQLNVTDADIGPNAAPFVFDIFSGNGQGSFRIESNGTIRTTSRLKYKVQEVHSLHVRVFDNGAPPLYSDAWVTIKVYDYHIYRSVLAIYLLTLWYLELEVLHFIYFFIIGNFHEIGSEFEDANNVDATFKNI